MYKRQTIVYTEIDEIRNKMLFIEKLFQSVTIAQRVQDTESILIEGFYSATIEGAKTTVEKVKQSFNNPQNKSDKMVKMCIRDSFCTQESSLALIKKYPVSQIKIDKEFILDVCENSTSQAIVCLLYTS